MTDQNQRPPARKLGRGLSALLGDDAGTVPQSGPATPPSDSSSQTVPVEFLVPSRLQPRRVFDKEEIASLAISIRERGILQPILVRRLAGDPLRFEIVAGERRWRAAQAAQLHEVPIIIRDLTDEGVLEVALVENVQRSDLNPLEEAEGYQRLIQEFGHTQDGLANIVGKSRSHIANMLRLLSLPEKVRALLDTGKISAGHARTLVGLPNAEAIAEKIVKSGLNVRQAERLAQAERQDSGTAAKGGRRKPAKDPDTRELEDMLSETVGLRVTIDFHGEGGRVTIAYDTLEQLDEVIRRLRSHPRDH